MKFVRRISIFFIYPMTMFSLGFVANSAIQEFFYPGEQYQEEVLVSSGAEKQEQAVETGYTRQPVITANTDYVVISYDMRNGSVAESCEMIPDSYIGYDREKLEEALRIYNESPSLKDLEKGYFGIELLSFSPEKVIVKKNYEHQKSGFYLLNENHHVVVYDESLNYLYLNTGIRTEDLPETLQEEVLHMKYIADENELYHFLESYSS